MGTTSPARIIRLSNSGGGTIFIKSISITGPFDFGGVWVPVKVGPTPVDIEITFAPTTAGPTPRSYLTIDSNAANSPTSIPLSGEGIVAVPLISVSPVSLDFGSQAAGTISLPQTVTVANLGTADLVVDSVGASPAEFSVTGPSVPATISPGNSASYSVTFAPAAAQSYAGLLTFTSNDTASPTSIPLAGTGTATPSPACGQLSDGLVHTPPDYATLLPPARGQSYTDPAFGCTITRLSDGPAQFGSAVHHEYASMVPFNSDNTRILLLTEAGGFFVVDPQGNVVVSPGGLGIGGMDEPRWSRSDPQVLYYHQGNQLKKRHLATGTTTVVRAFTQYTAINFGGGESDISEDGDHMVIIGNNRYVHVYQFSTDTLGPALDLAGRGYDWFDMTPNNNVLANYGSSGTSRFQGMELFDRNLVFLRQVIPFAGHADRGRDVNGDEVVVVVASNDLNPAPGCSGNGIEKVRLSDSQKTCLLPLYWGDSTHVSLSQNGWALISNTDVGSFSGGTASAVPCANCATNWTNFNKTHLNELTLVKLDGSEVRRLAHSRSRRLDGYWHTPRSAINRDGSLALFDSNFALYPVSNYTDVYLIGANPTQTDAPLISVVPGTVNFGDQAVGTTSVAQTVTVANGGTADLVVDSMTLPPVEFSVAGPSAPVTIPPGSSVDYSVAFQPAAAQSYTAQWTLNSNAATSPTTVTLTGTGLLLTAILNVSPTSLSFGSQSVGTTSAPQSVTLTNAGTASLTISNVTTASPFAFTGWLAPTTLLAGQSLPLAVTFTPTAAGSFTGSLTISSDATPSPVTVSLSGSGVTSGGTVAGCGLVGNTSVLTPTNYDLDLRPPLGAEFVDPVFGCGLQRLTDGMAQMGMAVHHEYSTMHPMNADNSRLLVHGGSRGFRLVDRAGALVVDEGTLGICQTCEPRWHHTDPNRLYYRTGNQIRRFDLATRTSALVRAFTEYASISFCGGEGDLSDDSDHLAVCGGGQIFVYTISTDTKGPAIAIPSGFDAAYMTPNNNVLVAAGGLQLYDSQMRLLRTVTSFGAHKDVGRDLDGQEVVVLVASNDSSPAPGCSGNGIEKIRLSDGAKTCLLPLYWGDSTHVSLSQNGWALISNSDVGSFSGGTASPPPCAACLTNWTNFNKRHLNEITLVKLDGSEVRRLAHHRSRRWNTYWMTPRAALSRDAALVVFDSNFGQNPATDYTDVFLILLQ